MESSSLYQFCWATFVGLCCFCVSYHDACSVMCFILCSCCPSCSFKKRKWKNDCFLWIIWQPSVKPAWALAFECLWFSCTRFIPLAARHMVLGIRGREEVTSLVWITEGWGKACWGLEWLKAQEKCQFKVFGQEREATGGWKLKPDLLRFTLATFAFRRRGLSSRCISGVLSLACWSYTSVVLWASSGGILCLWCVPRLRTESGQMWPYSDTSDKGKADRVWSVTLKIHHASKCQHFTFPKSI